MSAILRIPTYTDTSLELVERFRAVLTIPTSSLNLNVRAGATDTATVDIQDTNEGTYTVTHCTTRNEGLSTDSDGLCTYMQMRVCVLHMTHPKFYNYLYVVEYDVYSFHSHCSVL